MDPLQLIQEMLNRYAPVQIQGLPRFHGGAVGYLGYDAVKYFERVPTPPTDTLGIPDAIFLFVDTMLVFDHVRHKIKVVSHIHLDNGTIEAEYAEAVTRIEELVARLRKPLDIDIDLSGKHQVARSEVTSNRSKAAYEDMVRQVKEYIYSGDIIQAVISRRLTRVTSASPLSIYRALRTLNPSPYMYYLSMGDFHIVGASPELLVRVEDGVIYNFPLAGTRPRGDTVHKDDLLAEELRADEKEQAEHVMSVSYTHLTLPTILLV